jgi:hypothetical protein
VTADQAALNRAQSELDRLAALEPEPARTEPVPLGVTFARHWEGLNTVQRNEFLRSAGVRALASRDNPPPVELGTGSFTVIREKDLHAVVNVGNLGELLARVQDA